MTTLLGRHFGLICLRRNLMFYRIWLKKLSWLMKLRKHFLRRDSKLILRCRSLVDWRSFSRYLIGRERNLAHIILETHLSFAMDILTTSNYLTEEIISMQKGINGTTHFFMSDSSPFISKYRIIFKIFERSKTWKSKNCCKTDRQSSYRG